MGGNGAGDGSRLDELGPGADDGGDFHVLRVRGNGCYPRALNFDILQVGLYLQLLIFEKEQQSIKISTAR